MIHSILLSAVALSVCVTNPIYQKFFAEKEQISWEMLKSSPEEMVCCRAIDFSIDHRTWQQTAEAVGHMALKVVLFPLVLYDCVHYIVQRVMMIKIYPAQSAVIRWMYPHIHNKALDNARAELLTDPERADFVTRHLTLRKNGVSYSALMIGHKDQICNGNWILQATGNGSPVEYYAERARDLEGNVYRDVVGSCAQVGFNVLFVNPSGIGRSSGITTMANIGDGHEIGLSFLEIAVHAKRIVLAGHSIGGVAIADAVVKHEFKEGIDYHVISQQSLDSVENVFRGRFPEWAHLSRLVSWAGCDTDAPIKAARKLSNLHIWHTVTNAATEGLYLHDGVIPAQAALGYRLQEEGIVEHKEFIYTDKNHAYPLNETIEAIGKWASPVPVDEPIEFAS